MTYHYARAKLLPKYLLKIAIFLISIGAAFSSPAKNTAADVGLRGGLFAGARVSRVPIDTTKTIRDTLTIDEVQINTGYQRLPKERATGSFVQIDSALFNRAVSTDIISRLKGIAPSLLFDDREGGTPKLSIRGRSTIFAGADPLIVMDNFPYEGDLANINPNDVESVSILRDAAAASIWGVRAGNGVIVITTKKGKSGHKPQISLNTNVTVGTKPDLHYLPQIRPSDLVDVQEFLYRQGFYRAKLDNTVSYPAISPAVEILDDASLSEVAKQTQLALLKQGDLRRDLSRYFYRPSVNQQYALSLRGGSEKHQYLLAAGLDDNRTALVGNDHERINLSASQTLEPLPRLRIDQAIFYTYGGTQTNNSLQDIRQSDAYLQLADDAGNPLPVARHYRLSFAETAEDKGLLNWLYVPLDELAYAGQRQRQHHLRLNNSLRYTWFTGFSTSLLYQYEHQQSPTRNLYGEETYFTRHFINSFAAMGSSGVEFNFPRGAYLQLDHHALTAHSGRLQADYQLTRGDHALSLLGGIEIRQTRAEGNSQLILGYDVLTGTGRAVNQDSTFRQYPSGSWANLPSSNTVRSTVDRYRSYYANGSYTFRGRYTLSASARVDQSNLFGVRANQRSVPLWSAGLKWNAADEPFYQADWLPVLAVRATYGYNGNIDNTVTAFTTARYYRETATGLSYATVNSLPNADLRGERTGQLNIGVDFGLQNNMLSGSVEYYAKRGKDLLGYAPLNPTSGATRFYGNIASMRGEGVDVSLTVQPTRGSVAWSGTLFTSYVTDRITHYEVKPTVISQYFSDGSLTGGGFSPTVGKPLFSVYSYPWAGLDPETGAPRGYLNGTPSASYTAITRAMTVDSLVYHGRVSPPWFGAFRQMVSYGSISLSVNVSYKLGHYFRRPSLRYDFLYNSNNGHADYARRWQKPGDEATTDVPSRQYPLVSGSDEFYGYSEVLVEKGDHIRLQDIRLGVDLPRKSIQRIGLSQVTLYGYANNLGILWRANKLGIDPDYTGNVLPLTRTFALGLTANF